MASEEVWLQAQAEGLVLRVAENGTGYFGVHLNNPGYPKPYQAQLKYGGKKVSLGCFATAEEAALCVARSPESRAAVIRAAAAPPLTSEEARQQAQAQGVTLRVADNKTGYLGVYLLNPGTPNPYQAYVRRGGKLVHMGSFATAEEAALCVARPPDGQATAQRPLAAVPLTSEEARQQAQAEGLTLRVAENTAGYYGVHLAKPGRPRPYQAQLKRGGNVYLGSFATAEEAALCVARSPEQERKAAAEGKAAAKRKLAAEGKAAAKRKAAAGPAARRVSQRSASQRLHEGQVGAALAAATRAAAEAQRAHDDRKTVNTWFSGCPTL